MALVLTNTLSGRKEPLVPREPGHVRVYWCGVTVYARSHVGHARALVTADVLCRYLRARGLRVTFVRNFTDIDDKIIQRATAEGISTQALVEREIAGFSEDVRWLGCLPPTHEPRATTHIADMIALIERLVAAGFAYPVASGSVYFRVRRFAEYGKLSHQRLEDMAVGEEIDSSKEDPHDFALWKGVKPGEPFWRSPWGDGRPGWHIECSAMAARYLGQPFDVHGGGSDLVFPHHENEIAQSEAATGVPFATLWVHNGMITFGAEKMSKSLGNVFGIAEVAKKVPAEALRLLFLGTHYRSPLDFSSPARLDEGAKALDRLYEGLVRADDKVGPPEAVRLDGALATPDSPFLSAICDAMDDDLNAAKALGLVFDRVRELNRAVDAGDTAEIRTGRADLARVACALGVMETPSATYVADARARGQARAGLSAAEIEAAIAARDDARQRKDFRQADAIRSRLKEQGIVLEDTSSGTLWKAG
ncbi:MAG: cysteine--tRNA ligase [Candidatus Binatia bacterium]